MHTEFTALEKLSQISHVHGHGAQQHSEDANWFRRIGALFLNLQLLRHLSICWLCLIVCVL